MFIVHSQNKNFCDLCVEIVTSKCAFAKGV